MKYYRFQLFTILLSFAVLLFSLASLQAQRPDRQSVAAIHSAKIKLDVSGQLPASLRYAPDDRPDRASFFSQIRNGFNLSDRNSFNEIGQLTDQLSQTHYRYQQKYNNIPVEGAVYILHTRQETVFYANGRLMPDLKIDSQPSLSESAALAAALEAIKAQRYMWEDEDAVDHLRRETGNISADYYPRGELIYTCGNAEQAAENYRLAYRFDIYAAAPLSRDYVFIDAQTGELLAKRTRIHDVDEPGSGTSLYNGAVNITVDNTGSTYRLREAARSGLQTFDAQNGTSYPASVDFIDADGNFTGANEQAGVSAHWGAEQTYDYFFNEHGRNSFDNAGGIIFSYVHYDVNYNNAFWDGQRMTYGDGDGVTFSPLVSLDVVGHEITHGVTEFSANLVYQNEPGALNESFSDIFGAAIEFYGEGSINDWLIGEDFDIAEGNGIRSMDDPKSQGDPDTYFGTNWAPLSDFPSIFNDYGGVHTNSGVQNFWFYLLVTGGSGTNDNGEAYTVNGIGVDAAAAIAYRNLTVYLTDFSGFLDARNGSVDAATDLYGASSPEVQAVEDAWDAVGVVAPEPPDGVLVWEGSIGGQDYSGSYISNYLTNAGYLVKHTSVFPTTLLGYDAAFLSFGNYGTGGSNTVFNDGMANLVIEYLQNGGKVYLEGGDALGFDQDDNPTLLSLLGISSTADGVSAANPVSNLNGQSGTIAENMFFSNSTQSNNNYIDTYNAGAGTVAFVETGYGDVAVQHQGAGHRAFSFSYTLAELTDGASPSTRDDIMSGLLNFFQLIAFVTVDAKVQLQGPFSSGSMNTYLGDNTLLPDTQPYNMAPWDYSGDESVSGMPAGVVDWVLVKLRTGTAASTAVATRAALLLSDGSIVDTDGVSPVRFQSVDPDDYYLVICHRNHLAVMSAAAITIDENSAAYDFTSSQSQAYGLSPMSEIQTGIFGLRSGDANGDGGVDVLDLNLQWRMQNGTTWLYNKGADLNLDGGIDVLDRNLHWRPDNGLSTQVP